MKVLFLVNIPSPYRVDFFQELGKLCELTVLYELKKASDRNDRWESSVLNKSYKEVYLKPVVKQASSAWCPSVTKYLGKQNYDIIVVGGYSTPTGIHAIRYLKRHKIPYLLNCDGGMIAHGENILKKRLKTGMISGASAYLSTGKAADEYLIYYGAEKPKIFHYPFTTLHEKDLLNEPVSQNEKLVIRKKLEIEEEKMILSVGNFIPRKGFDILLRVAKDMDKQIGIYLVGGKETDEYRRIREELGLKNIHYIPFMNQEKLRGYYLSADIFVLPTREDIWGLVINEAMSMGLPVITTERCVAGVEMLESECIVPVEQEEMLSRKIMDFLDNPEILKEQAKRNLKKSRTYTIENMAKVHYDIFTTFREADR